LNKKHPGHIDFRIAETPIFCDKSFTTKMLSACESIIDVIISPTYVEQSAKAIPAGLNVPEKMNILSSLPLTLVYVKMDKEVMNHN
jgi:hypothetical protein